MINFIELDRTHNRGNFDCGIEELNYFLKNMRVISISEHAGVVGFFVDAKNSAAKRCYQKFGFIPLPDHPLQLFLPLATLQKMYEIAISNNVSR